MKAEDVKERVESLDAQVVIFDDDLSPAQLQFVAQKFDMIVGLDNHGYNFPGLIYDLRAENPRPFDLVTPGIRMAEADTHDQRRTSTRGLFRKRRSRLTRLGSLLRLGHVRTIKDIWTARLK